MIEIEQYFEDYEVGSERVTGGRTITETDIVMHAMHSGDFYPHHVDAEFAKTTPFGQRIAQFSCTFSIGIALTASISTCSGFCTPIVTFTTTSFLSIPRVRNMLKELW